MKVCRECQKPLPGAPRQQLYCQPCGVERKRVGRLQRNKRKRIAALSEPVACPVCATQFVRTHGRQKHCGPVCRKKHELVLDRNRRAAARRLQVRNCIACSDPMPGAAVSRLRCEPCALEREKQRKRDGERARQARIRAADLAAFNKQRSCTACSGPMPADAPRAQVMCGAECGTDWRSVAHRIAKHAGPDSAALFTFELNKHRRLNGRAEVRL